MSTVKTSEIAYITSEEVNNIDNQQLLESLSSYFWTQFSFQECAKSTKRTSWMRMKRRDPTRATYANTCQQSSTKAIHTISNKNDIGDKKDANQEGEENEELDGPPTMLGGGSWLLPVLNSYHQSSEEKMKDLSQD